jgi:hypothetical protein
MLPTQLTEKIKMSLLLIMGRETTTLQSFVSQRGELG